MALTVILVECDVTSPAGAAATLRFADRAVFPMPPTDADRANVAWEERIIEPPSLRRTLFDDLQQFEPGLGVGALTLANADRALDAYQGHVWGEVRVWRWTYGEAFSTARPLMRGPAAGTPAYDVSAGRPGRVRLTLYDYRVELERALQTATYAGTNNGTTIFYEGEAALAGKPKPLALGELLDAHLPGVLVNAAQQAYQIHDGQVNIFPTVPALIVNDRGSATTGLTFAGEAASLSAFISTTPSTNQQTSYAPMGLTRFNFNPVGTVTFSAFGDASDGGYANTPGPILKRLLKRAGVPDGRIGASVAALASTRVVGVYVDDATTARELVGFVAKAVPAAVLPDRSGVWQAVRIAAPALPAAFTLAADEILAVEADEGGVDGAGDFRVGWGRIWTTFRRENLLPDLRDTAEEKRLAETYQFASVQDAAYKTRFLNWRTLTLETALRYRAAAESLAQDLRTLFGLRPDGRARRRWRVTLEMTDAALALELGATVAMNLPQAGGDGLFLLLGEELMRPRRDQMIWTLWG